MIAVVYIIVVLLPLMARGHFKSLPRDFIEAAVLYSLPMSAVAGASAVGWLLAYLGAHIVHRLDRVGLRRQPHRHHVPHGGRAHHRGRLPRRRAGHRHLHAHHHLALPARPHPPGPHGRAHHREPGLRPHHAAVRAHSLLSSTLAGVSFARALRQAVPLYGVYFLVITIIIFFPNVVLWLPRLMVPTSRRVLPRIRADPASSARPTRGHVSRSFTAISRACTTGTVTGGVASVAPIPAVQALHPEPVVAEALGRTGWSALHPRVKTRPRT